MSLSREPKLILAVDGGGSKTLCWIATDLSHLSHNVPTFEILGRGQSGPSNPRSVGFDQAFENLELAMRAAIQQGNDSTSSNKMPSIAVACLSLAGVGRSAEKQRVREWAEQRPWAHQIIVVDDVEPLRFAARYEHQNRSTSMTHDDSEVWDRSITLVVGTGTIATGCDEHGNSARSDGWGYLLGDQGSGYSIGLSGLRSICQAHDQGVELSAFHRALLAHLKLEDPTQMISWIYQDVLPRPSIAELARIVLGFADKDPIADALMNDAVEAMARNISNVASCLGFAHSDYALALSGGIVRHHPRLVDRLLLELSKRNLTPCLSHVVSEPIHGAIVMASKG